MRLMDIRVLSLFNGSKDHKWWQWLEKTNKFCEIWRTGSSFRVLGFSRKMRNFLRSKLVVCVGGLRLFITASFANIPKANQRGIHASFRSPGAHFSKEIAKKRLFILFRGFRWLQTRFSGWKFKSWQICFIANKIPVVVRAAGIIWHDFHAFVRSEISSSVKTFSHHESRLRLHL